MLLNDLKNNISEETLTFWAKGPGKTESDKAANTEAAIRKAIVADAELSKLDISVFAQGSYMARTNIRQDSDVDICVRGNLAFYPEYPEGKTGADYGNVDSDLRFSDFKNMIERALKSYFGTASVKRGNKAFDIHANSYRVDADVVPALEHRRYIGQFNFDGSPRFLSGIAFMTDDGKKIYNWPQQNYENGVSRNDATVRLYKRTIRILKNLRSRMQEDGVAEAQNIASFLIECLVWNAPLEAFKQDSFTLILRHVIADVYNKTRNYEDCKEWGEVNELKYLFRTTQPWSREQANKFLGAAWNYMGFK